MLLSYACNLHESLTEPRGYLLICCHPLARNGPIGVTWSRVRIPARLVSAESAGWRSGASPQAAHPHPRSATICNHLLITVALRARAAAAMLCKLLVCILLTTSADALEAGPISRRALLGKATAGAFLSSPLAAFARDPLKQASDAAVYDRADEGSLTSARVIQRAETNQLVVGQGTPLPLMAARRPPQTAT